MESDSNYATLRNSSLADSASDNQAERGFQSKVQRCTLKTVTVTSRVTVTLQQVFTCTLAEKAVNVVHTIPANPSSGKFYRAGTVKYMQR